MRQLSLGKTISKVYVIEIETYSVSDLQQVGGFSPGSVVSSYIKTDRCEITEILLKVSLNAITPYIVYREMVRLPVDLSSIQCASRLFLF
jgi:mannitol-specific phosphotransferase system IIBC component